MIAATSPATGIAVERRSVPLQARCVYTAHGSIAASFLLAAWLTAAMRLPSSLRMERSNFLADLSLGWHEFASRAWLWSIVLQFAIVNAVVAGLAERARAGRGEGALRRRRSVGA